MKRDLGRISQSDALTLVFRFRVKAATMRGCENPIEAAIAQSRSKNGGSDSKSEPAKDGDPHLPQG